MIWPGSTASSASFSFLARLSTGSETLVFTLPDTVRAFASWSSQASVPVLGTGVPPARRKLVVTSASLALKVTTRTSSPEPATLV